MEGRGRRVGRWSAAAALLPVLFMCAHAGAEGGAPGGAGGYAGIFAGAGRTAGRLVDLEGFANWGRAGWVSDYADSGLAGGALLGKRFRLGGARLRVELDAAGGGRAAKTDRLDPEGRDETARMRYRWVATARVGVEKEEGPVTLFMSGGAAAAGIVNSVTDIDFRRDQPPAFDPDDSFHDRSTVWGGVLGLGVEAPLAGAWTLRIDGSYLHFGRRAFRVNRSGNNPCGPGGPRRPCRYRVENSLAMARLALIYRFGR